MFSLELAPRPPPAQDAPAAADDAAAETRQTRALLLDSVTAAFAAKHGRAPSDDEIARLAAAVDAKLGADDADDGGAPLTGKAQRAKKREQRERAAAAFVRAEGRAPTDAELDEVLAVVAPSAAGAGTPAKPPAQEPAPSPCNVADVPC